MDVDVRVRGTIFRELNIMSFRSLVEEYGGRLTSRFEILNNNITFDSELFDEPR